MLRKSCRNAVGLLERAAVLYDNPATGIAAGARSSVSGGFSSGGRWMASTLEQLRGSTTLRSPLFAFSWLGTTKYLLCLVVFYAVYAVARKSGAHPAVALGFSTLGFYSLEVQMLFLFPLAIDGSRAPFSESGQLMRKHIGTPRAVIIVLILAGQMLFGGFLGKGFLRSWSLGCLAVLLWYEELIHLERPFLSSAKHV